MECKFDVDVEQSALQYALNRVIKTASKENAGIETSAVYVEAKDSKIKFFTQKNNKGNTAVAVAECIINQPGNFAVPVLKFSGIVSDLIQGKVNLKILSENNNKLTIVQGNTKISLQQYAELTKDIMCINMDNILSEKDTSVYKVNISAFLNAGSKCNIFVKNQTNVYENVFIVINEKEFKIFSTDRTKMQRVASNGVNYVSGKKETVIAAPSTFFSDLACWCKGFPNDEMVEVIVSEKFIILRKNDEIFSSILVDIGGQETYEKYKNIIDTPLKCLDSKNEIIVPIDLFKKMVARINVLIGTNEIDKNRAETKLSVKDNILELAYKGANDSCKDEIGVDNPSNAQFYAKYNNSWISTLISNITADFLCLSVANFNGRKTMIFHPKDDLTHIVLSAVYSED